MQTQITVDAATLRVCLDKCVEDHDIQWALQIEGDHNILSLKAHDNGLVTLTVHTPEED